MKLKLFSDHQDLIILLLGFFSPLNYQYAKSLWITLRSSVTHQDHIKSQLLPIMFSALVYIRSLTFNTFSDQGICVWLAVIHHQTTWSSCLLRLRGVWDCEGESTQNGACDREDQGAALETRLCSPSRACCLAPGEMSFQSERYLFTIHQPRKVPLCNYFLRR